VWEQLLQFSVLRLHDSICSQFGPYHLHWGSAVLTCIAILFIKFVVPETSNRSLEEIETFFTHLRREAMDMIGDRAACREPVNKEPFVRIRLSRETKEGYLEKGKSDTNDKCKIAGTIDLEKEIAEQVNRKRKLAGNSHIEFTDIDLRDGASEQNQSGNDTHCNALNDSYEDINRNCLENTFSKPKSRN